MSKIFIGLVVVAGILVGVAPSQAQTPAQTCPAGQSGIFPYCQVVPPVPPAACSKFTSKMSIARATFSRDDRTIDILAPITKLASGTVAIGLQAAGRTTSFTAPVDSAAGQIAVVKRILASQALLGTGILTVNYPGDADTRPQVVRLRAANHAAKLELVRPTITADGHLVGSGSVTNKAEGVVRTQLEFTSAVDGTTTTLEFKATIGDNGKWSLNVQLPPAALAAIALRCGTVHSYTLFTGYLPRLIRGEIRSLQVLPAL